MLNQNELKEAAQIRATMDRRLAQIAASRDLTPRAVARERAKAILAARDAMSAIRQRNAERTAGEQEKAYRQAFGIRPDRSGEDRAYRDSLSARAPSYDEAGTMYRQAVARGDELAQTALAEYAWSQRDNPLDGHAWVDGILQPYGESRPEYDSAIVTMLSAERPDRMDQLRDKVMTEIAQPSDLHGDLRTLAADDAEAAG
jgi:hypothetical protein